MKPTLLALTLLPFFLNACATSATVSAERQSELQTRAQECMRAHPEVTNYEVDRFGYVTAYYRMTGDSTVTAPFFRCVFP